MGLVKVLVPIFEDVGTSEDRRVCMQTFDECSPCSTHGTWLFDISENNRRQKFPLLFFFFSSVIGSLSPMLMKSELARAQQGDFPRQVLTGTICCIVNSNRRHRNTRAGETIGYRRLGILGLKICRGTMYLPIFLNPCTLGLVLGRCRCDGGTRDSI